MDWLGTFTSLLGTIIILLSVRALRVTFTIATSVKENTRLATGFPFNLSRNPMYVGGLLLCFSWSLLQRSAIAFALTVFLAFVLNGKVKIEEGNLERVFGDKYRRYKASVRRYI